ncbi:hypothetical protein MMPV_005889 [Pyropia vietnamensis]
MGDHSSPPGTDTVTGATPSLPPAAEAHHAHLAPAAALWAATLTPARSLTAAVLLDPTGGAVSTSWTARSATRLVRVPHTVTHVRGQGAGGDAYTATPPVGGVRGSPSPCRTWWVVKVPAKADAASGTAASDSGGGGGGVEGGGGDAFLELWGPSGLATTVRVPPAVHGPFCTDEWFGGGGGWSPDCRFYIYAAEAPARGAALDGPAARDGGGSGRTDGDAAPAGPRVAKTVVGAGMVETYADRDDDFGECYVRRRLPTLFLVDWGAAVPLAGDGDDDDHASAVTTDLAAPTVTRLGGVPPGLAVGDAVWSPDGATVAFTGRPAVGGGEPDAPAFQPGLRFCYNRRSAVYVAASPVRGSGVVVVGGGGGGGGATPALTDVVRVSGDDGCARSPRFHMSGRAIVWLATPWTGAHNSASVLRVGVRRPASGGGGAVATAGWADAALATVVGVVPGFPPATDFPGLYAHALPTAPWLHRDTLLVTSAWGSRSVVLRVRVDMEAVLAGGDGGDDATDPAAPVSVAVALPDASVMVHDVSPGGVALIEASGPDTPPWVAVATESDAGAAATASPACRERSPPLCLTPVTRRVDLGVITARTQYLRRVDKTPAECGGGVGGAAATAEATAGLPADAAAIRYALVEPDTADVADAFHVVLLTPSADAAAAVPPANNDAGEGVAAGGGPPAGVRRASATTATPPPLILFPHGGPHSAYNSAYSPALTAYVRTGYAVAMVNFRGSTGAPQASVVSLLGRAGTQDVGECVAATWWALDTLAGGLKDHAGGGDGDDGNGDGDGDGNGDGDGDGCAEDNASSRPRVGIVGGSHGGFLGAHLSARYPSTYATAVLRNAVVDVATMAGGTDILDWCYVEAGVAAEGGVDGPAAGGAAAYPVSLAALTAMWNASPVAWIRPAGGATKRLPPPPTLLQVGGSDRRVPPQQSREWARCVRAAGGIVAVRHYAGEMHAIDGVGGGDDAIVHALAWLWTHLG